MVNKFRKRYHKAIDIITALMILLFVYTGVSKLISRQSFFNQIKDAPYIGSQALWLSWIVPIAELIIATLLLFKSSRLVGYYAFTLSMVCFTIYISLILSGDQPLPCSCGGVIQKMNWQQHLVFNCCYILLAVAAIILHQKIKK